MDKGSEFRPEARKRRLIVKRLAAETLVYDLDKNEAHCLNPAASLLWQACDGKTPISRIGQAGRGSGSDIAAGLAELSEAGLLVLPMPASPSRRRALGRIGRAMALPAVVSVLVPNAATAQTCLPNGVGCGNSGQCCSGCCKSNGGPAVRLRCITPGPTDNCV